MPPIEHLIGSSESELQQLELAALDLSAQCVKRAEAELKQAVAHREAAGVYRWLINEREKLIRLSRTIADGKQGMLRFVETAIITRRST